MVKPGDLRPTGTILDRRRRSRGLIAGAVSVLGAGATVGFLGVNNVLEAIGLGFVDVPSIEDVQRKTFEELTRETKRATETVWAEIFEAEFGADGRAYQPPRLVLFDTEERSGCGPVAPGRAPVYCVVDATIYLDLRFFAELEDLYAATGGRLEYAPRFVIAHEVGHHVQALLGETDRLFGPDRDQEAEPEERIQVRLELQADCYAGVWAHHAEEGYGALEVGAVEEVVVVIEAFADDARSAEGAAEEAARGSIRETTMSHGTREQRVRWATIGYRSGAMADCDTFSLPFSEL